MTESEAIKLGQALYENLTSNANNIIPTQKYSEFVKIAIEALEEIQQYRAIGTVEELKALKEKNETLKALYENARKEGNHLIIKAKTEAVNEFAERLHNLCGFEIDDIQYPYLLDESRIDEIAEQLRGGSDDEPK